MSKIPASEYMEYDKFIKDAEPCEDCISREAFLDAFWKLNVELRPSAIDAITNMIDGLPSVTPKQKTNVLDKIRSYIEESVKINQNLNTDRARALRWCLDVIDFCSEKSEDTATKKRERMTEEYVRKSDVVKVLTNNRVHFCDMVKITSEINSLDTFEFNDQESVIDKIKADIEKLDGMYVLRDQVFYAEKDPKHAGLWYIRLKEVIDILDEYKEGGSE